MIKNSRFDNVQLFSNVVDKLEPNAIWRFHIRKSAQRWTGQENPMNLYG
jgi:hypothetical protein